MMRRTFVWALALITIAACNGEKRRLLVRRTELEQQRSAIEKRIETYRQAMRDAQLRLDTLNTTLVEHNGTTRAYIVQNQTAAACIRAAAITLGDDSEYRAQVGAIAQLGTMLCTVALLNQRFAAHVAEVAGVITQAEKRAHDLKGEIKEIRLTMDADQERVRRAQAELEQIENDLDDVRGQLVSQ